MNALPESINLPLKFDDEGTIRVSGTRVTLDTVIACYRQGDSPEAIHEGFPSVPLNDIYATLAYYISHQEELDDYLKQRDDEAEQLRQEIEAHYSPEQQARTAYFRSLLARKHNDQGT